MMIQRGDVVTILNEPLDLRWCVASIDMILGTHQQTKCRVSRIDDRGVPRSRWVSTEMIHVVQAGPDESA